VRFETAPGEQMQVDVWPAPGEHPGNLVRVFFVCAVLGFSAPLSSAVFERPQDDWREGIAGAVREIGGVPPHAAHRQ